MLVTVALAGYAIWHWEQTAAWVIAACGLIWSVVFPIVVSAGGGENVVGVTIVTIVLFALPALVAAGLILDDERRLAKRKIDPQRTWHVPADRRYVQEAGVDVDDLLPWASRRICRRPTSTATRIASPSQSSVSAATSRSRPRRLTSRAAQAARRFDDLPTLQAERCLTLQEQPDIIRRHTVFHFEPTDA